MQWAADGWIVSQLKFLRAAAPTSASAILQTGEGPETQRAFVSRRVSRFFYWLTIRFLLVLGVEGDFPRYQTWPLKVGALSKSPLCDDLLSPAGKPGDLRVNLATSISCVPLFFIPKLGLAEGNSPGSLGQVPGSLKLCRKWGGGGGGIKGSRQERPQSASYNKPMWPLPCLEAIGDSERHSGFSPWSARPCGIRPPLSLKPSHACSPFCPVLSSPVSPSRSALCLPSPLSEACHLPRLAYLCPPPSSSVGEYI